MISSSQSKLSGVHRTAFHAAAMRAAHLSQAAEPKIFRDEFALRLADMTEAEAIAFAARAGQAEGTSAWVLRSRFTEDRLAAARARVNQYVILGAGLDSFGLRMGESLGSLTVFEVDDPPLQVWKRQRIETLGLLPPKQLRFVPCPNLCGARRPR